MRRSKKLVPYSAILGALTLAACSDASRPTAPSMPSSPNPDRSPRAQARLESLFQSTSPEVMAIPGTVFADNDEVAGRLVFGVENAAAIIGVRNALARLGVDDSDYSIEMTQPILSMETLRDLRRPTVAGFQIHFSRYVCSIGFNATDMETGQASMYTASHCTATQGGTEGTLYYQPTSSTPGSFIATEAEDPVYVKGGAGCPKGKKCRKSDASRAVYTSGVTGDHQIAQTTGFNNGSLTLSGAPFHVTTQDTSTKSFPIGMDVNKVGRTTGWTRGKVTRTCVNTSVSGSTVYLFCQTFVSDPDGATVVSGGDSGSGVFSNPSGGNVTLLGILWGGSSDNKMFVFSPLASVSEELGALKAN